MRIHLRSPQAATTTTGSSSLVLTGRSGWAQPGRRRGRQPEIARTLLWPAAWRPPNAASSGPQQQQPPPPGRAATRPPGLSRPKPLALVLVRAGHLEMLVSGGCCCCWRWWCWCRRQSQSGNGGEPAQRRFSAPRTATGQPHSWQLEARSLSHCCPLNALPLALLPFALSTGRRCLWAGRGLGCASSSFFLSLSLRLLILPAFVVILVAAADHCGQ